MAFTEQKSKGKLFFNMKQSANSSVISSHQSRQTHPFVMGYIMLVQCTQNMGMFILISEPKNRDYSNTRNARVCIVCFSNILKYVFDCSKTCWHNLWNSRVHVANGLMKKSRSISAGTIRISKAKSARELQQRIKREIVIKVIRNKRQKCAQV